MVLSIDIETYSDIKLRDSGVYKYVDSDKFKILLFAYAFDDDPVQLVDLAQGEEIPLEVTEAIHNDVFTKSAFNAQFERVALSKHLGVKLEPESWECTMVKALTLGLPMGLGKVAEALNFEADKQKFVTGKSLIRTFCMPRKPTKANPAGRHFPADKPEEWQQFKDYCIQDVVVEREIRNKLTRYKTTKEEMKIWHIDQRVNDYGVKLDFDFVKQAIAMDESYSNTLANQYVNLTGLENPNSTAQLRGWLEEKLGQEVKSVAKGLIPELTLLADEKGLHDVIEALELRQEISKTSVSKYKKMEEVICSDGRARGLLQFYGASRTGRWAGRLIQVQNLPRNKIKDLDLAREVVKSGDLELLDMIYDRVPDILSQLIRTAFVPSVGNRFIVSDFSAIEARVIAWIAGEQWRLDVFETHGKIYEASASAMFNIPLDKIDGDLRSKGKVAELALGYQGSVGALIQMGALDMGLEEDELQGLVNSWRSANSKIVQFWYDVQSAANKCIRERRTVHIQKGISFIYDPGVMFIQLPSGRKLAYLRPRIEPHHSFQGATKITYEGVGTGNQWIRLDTYGGKLVENIVQATARDCLRDAIIRVHEAGYKIAFHVHDEVVLDTPIGEGSLEDVNGILGQPIDWAPGLTLNAEGFETFYYEKD